MKPLRIALVSMHTSPAELPGAGDAGGMNVVERHHAFALADLGHHVEFITRRASPDAPELLELAPRVTLRHVSAGPPIPLAKSAIDAHIEQFRQGLSELGPYDVIHSHHWMSGVAALPLARDWGIPHVQSYHSVAALPGSPLGQGEPAESPGRVPGEALLARESDVVVTISAAEARTVITRCGADPERVTIVSPGVDLEHFRPLHPGEEAWAPAGDAAYPRGFVFFAARLQPLKDPELAIRALARVPAAMRPHLVVAGDVSADFADYAADLHALVASLGLTGEVTFSGALRRDELGEALRSAQIVLVPSHSETFGLIALEASASGTPVIAAAAGGLREAVVHGESGQLMDSREPVDWGRCLTWLLADPQHLAEMGLVSRIHARRFSWADAGRRLADLYVGLIAQTARR